MGEEGKRTKKTQKTKEWESYKREHGGGDNEGKIGNGWKVFQVNVTSSRLSKYRSE